ncbi:glucose-6-phosphate dehydrogenase assembly protein OpcA [Cryobacterium sp. 1639]|uniref:glucose-6-phosphate dehydrogenase assembly protein OpcA n=1 Tax=Cryobacterium inferilacus TaxID=2866629 RepID=UPI001C73624A|nr:glucose-6-phosphate dehydrogenase assembly protein OpcA [Cryobacterium sp. 1639]MBX0298399.1 glucose-6-phosphate dehydrogenase assembly protein OpcA [Cryobacterium sp. 1639]
MIVDLPNTTTAKISKALVRIREEGGAVALGRVLTLIIAAELGQEEEAIGAANDASREHPMRVIVLSTQADAADCEPRVDAEIRVGGDAGASEVIVLRAYGDAASDPESLVTGLLLPDAPVVAWWPGEAPAVPAESPLGRIAYRRITDASAQADPQAALTQICSSYRPGDTDFAWTRLTLWRAQLAAVLDQPPYESITAVSVTGALDSPSTTLLAAWLQLALQVPVHYELTSGANANGIHGVHLTRSSGVISLEREVPGIATLTQSGQPVQDLTLKRRSLRDCLSDELRRLDPDELYGQVITQGLPQLEGPATPTGEHS